MDGSKESLFNGDVWGRLSTDNREWLRIRSDQWRLTFQETRQLILMIRDWEQWGSPQIREILDQLPELPLGKPFTAIKSRYDEERGAESIYPHLPVPATGGIQKPPRDFESHGPILGKCPVASTRTRCCNLQTLDAVMGCGFGCHYCSIQSFYEPGVIRVTKNLAEALDRFNPDPNRWYHIGTGQSSDSLLYGNRNGILDILAAFSRSHPKVILELKSKSAKLDWFMENPVPANMILTWSLNTPSVIRNEEPGTASLENRLAAARKAADKGILIGFHFHPIIRYKGWEYDYRELALTVRKLFSPEEIVMISLGTLTFPKKALRAIRSSAAQTQVLRIPLEETGGKYSYPRKIKQSLFSTVRDVFNGWEQQVFFYLCMEEPELWLPVLGREYISNEDFEQDMLNRYAERIQVCRDKRSS